MKWSFAVFAALFLTFGLAGCATSTPAVKLSAPVVFGRAASLDFILVNATNALPGVQAETTQLQDSIVSGLRETGSFGGVDVVAPAEAAGGIRVVAAIKQITKVSKSARIWYGGLAGKARVVVRVSVTDLAAGKPIEDFEVEGHTGASARAGLTDEAVQRAAAQVVDEIRRLSAETAKYDLDHGRLN